MKISATIPVITIQFDGTVTHRAITAPPEMVPLPEPFDERAELFIERFEVESGMSKIEEQVFRFIVCHVRRPKRNSRRKRCINFYHHTAERHA